MAKFAIVIFKDDKYLSLSIVGRFFSLPLQKKFQNNINGKFDNFLPKMFGKHLIISPNCSSRLGVDLIVIKAFIKAFFKKNKTLAQLQKKKFTRRNMLANWQNGLISRIHILHFLKFKRMSEFCTHTQHSFETI